jgi:hypothetical protein
MTEEKNQLESELDELKEKFDDLDDKLILEFEFRKMRCRRSSVTGFEDLSDLGLKSELINLFNSGKLSSKHEHLTLAKIEETFRIFENIPVDTKPYEKSIKTSSQSLEERISAIKEKWKPIHDFDASRPEPQLFKEEQKKSNAVIHSGAMYKDGKRIASFLRSK